MDAERSPQSQGRMLRYRTHMAIRHPLRRYRSLNETQLLQPRSCERPFRIFPSF